MTDTQLYLVIGVPGTIALIGILVNVGYFIALNGRMGNMEGKLGSMAEQTAVHKALLDIVLDKLEARLHR